MPRILVHTTAEQPAVGQLIQFDILVESPDVAINAYQGIFLLPEQLSVVEIRDTLSLVRMWITKPEPPPPGSPITFAGITPGGFTGNGPLFSIIARIEKEGTYTLNPDAIQILGNDGKGTVLETSAVPLTFTAVNSGESSGSITFAEDRTPPEAFLPQLITDAVLTQKRQVLGFFTTDTGTGIANYQFIDGKNPPISVSSPLIIQQHLLSRTIAIRAVDYAGNSREAMVFIPGKLPISAFHAALLCSAISACGILVMFFMHRRRRT